LIEARESNLPIMYVHHGKFFQVPVFWKAMVEALDGLNVRVAASLGQMGCGFGPLPDGIFARSHLPQSQVLRHARVVIATGNTTAFVGALEAGVPSLIIPAGGEQPEIAELGRRLGVSIVIEPGEATADQIRPSLASLLENTSYSECALYCGSKLLKAGRPFQRVAELLELLANERRPILREQRSALREVSRLH
jgi:UDP:flavonoid glycosyltransferase YjiC (YdhE family)